MRLPDGSRVAVIGAGPGGLAAAKHMLAAGFAVSVFEASDAIGGQWNTGTAHSGVWPGLHTNTSRALTAFSDFPPPPGGPLHPAADQVRSYLCDYASRFGVDRCVRLDTRVDEVRHHPGGPASWTVDGEPFDAVVVASGRFRRPRRPPGLEHFGGTVLHAFDYPGAAAMVDRAVLVYGNGVSGLEVATSLAGRAARTISAYRTPRYVMEKVSDGVSSDWRWYTMFGALERRTLAPEEFGRRLRRRVVADAGHPADFGAPAPDPDIRRAGTSLAQGYLQAVAAGDITCRPGITGVEGQTVAFADGTRTTVDTIVCATGYDIDLPYLDAALADAVAAPGGLYLNTWHPGLPSLGVIGQYAMQGPYFPLLELQGRWIAAVFAGDVPAPTAEAMRSAPARPPLEAHNALALALSEASGVAPDLRARPDLAEPLLFGPMLPARYRLDGPGADADAERLFAAELTRAPRVPPARDDVATLRDELGLGDVADRLTTRLGSAS